MNIVFLTALGVGGATLLGSVIGFIFKNITHKFSDVVLSFAAGIMLAASVIGLILPAMEYGGTNGLIYTISGIFAGTFCLIAIDKLVPHSHSIMGGDKESHPDKLRIDKIMLFVMAIAIHNLPEGLAAGVGFGSGNAGDALLIAGGIALQNIPEGMVIIGPMLGAGIPPKKTFIYALMTGIVEVVGTFLGYFAISFSTAILPFALAFAGGTMLYIISDEIIPETHAHGSERGATLALIVGFCIMLVFDTIIS